MLSARAELEARIRTPLGLDSVDVCRMRLLSLRTRIDMNWPQETGRVIRRGGLSPESQTTISDLLAALPSPLPISTGATPECIFNETDTDLRLVAGRAVDAGLALLEGSTMERVYNGNITMLESYHPDAPAPIVLQSPTVGLLVSTIIGTLEAISELIVSTESPKQLTPEPKPAVPLPLKRHEPKPEKHDERGPGAPRI